MLLASFVHLLQLPFAFLVSHSDFFFCFLHSIQLWRGICVPPIYSVAFRGFFFACGLICVAAVAACKWRCYCLCYCDCCSHWPLTLWSTFNYNRMHFIISQQWQRLTSPLWPILPSTTAISNDLWGQIFEIVQLLDFWRHFCRCVCLRKKIKFYHKNISNQGE